MYSSPLFPLHVAPFPFPGFLGSPIHVLGIDSYTNNAHFGGS